MIKQPYKIGVITSSISLLNLAKEIEKKTDEEIQISSKGLKKAIPVGKEMERNGVEVIISVLGTASLLRENLSIPVLSIPLTSFDLIKSFTAAAVFDSRVLLLTFRENVEEIHFIEKLLNIKIFQGVYDDSESLENQILLAREKGFGVGIGGGMAMRISAKHDFKIIEVEASQAVIEATIESAKSVAHSGRQEKEKAIQYRYILDSPSEGIIATDQRGNITAINKSAKQFLQVSENHIQGKPIWHYIPKAPIINVMNSKKPVLNRVKKINKEQFIFNHIPIIMDKRVLGSVSTFNHISNVIRAENEVRRSLTRGLIAKYNLDDFLYQSAAMQNVIDMTRKIASSNSTILIIGETGTGKEILSNAIHNLSHRKNKAFVSINCAALPELLLESELFGYEDGAFTGSRRGGKAGLFEMAHNGTILLDEFAEMPHSVQLRLLRVLQEKEVMRIAGNSLIPINVRVIANSNKDLIEEVRNGRIREDLFFRLNVLQIQIPPLRERVEDIPLLVDEFIRKLSREHNLKPISIPLPLLTKLMDYAWPGNVRQLLNFIEGIVVFCCSRFSSEIFETKYNELISFSLDKNKVKDDQVSSSLPGQKQLIFQTNEAERIFDALEKCRFNKGKTAAFLGISRTTLWEKIKKYNIR